MSGKHNMDGVEGTPGQEFSHGVVINVKEINWFASQNKNESVNKLPNLKAGREKQQADGQEAECKLHRQEKQNARQAG
jgi:hypothetical protein